MIRKIKGLFHIHTNCFYDVGINIFELKQIFFKKLKLLI